MNVYNEICAKGKTVNNGKEKDLRLRFYKEGKLGLSFMPGVLAEYIKNNASSISDYRNIGLNIATK